MLGGTALLGGASVLTGPLTAAGDTGTVEVTAARGAQTATPAADPVVEPLPSWNEGAARQAILDFVAAVTGEGGADFVSPAQRIATFDLDGTLWVSHPIYSSLVFAFDRLQTLAPSHPEWGTQEPFKTLLAGEPAAMAAFSEQDIATILAASHAGTTVADYEALVVEWLATARHPRFDRPYPTLIYQPMLEVMDLLRANDFATYIVSGSGQEFIRAFAEPVFGVAPEQVIGSASQTNYETRAGGPVLVMQPGVLIVDDGPGKAEAINLIIGRRPYAAFGNSNGDREMLEWTGAGAGARLMMLVHHDDAEREYAYDAQTTVGTFSAALMAEARERGWVVISMQHDWRQVFPS